MELLPFIDIAKPHRSLCTFLAHQRGYSGTLLQTRFVYLACGARPESHHGYELHVLPICRTVRSTADCRKVPHRLESICISGRSRVPRVRDFTGDRSGVFTRSVSICRLPLSAPGLEVALVCTRRVARTGLISAHLW